MQLNSTMLNCLTLSDILKSHKHICWYPSAGRDFREMLFFSKQYYSVHKAEFANAAPSKEVPDLFLLTDLIPWKGELDYARFGHPLGNSDFDKLESGKLKCGDFLFYDDYTQIKVLKYSYLEDVGVPFHAEFCDMAKPQDFGRAYYFQLEISSKHQQDKRVWETNLVYVITENTAFAFDYLVKNEIHLDYVVAIRYGEAFGGSRVWPTWIYYLLGQFRTRYFIEAGYDYDVQAKPEIPEMVKKYYGEIMEQKDMTSIPALKSINHTDELIWGNYGDVQWYAVNQ